MKNLTDTTLVEQLRDATYDSGYESGKRRDGQAPHVAAIARRQELQQELERRLFEGRQARAELERIRDALAGAGIEDNSDMLAEWITRLANERTGHALLRLYTRRCARAWKKAAKGWRQAARESLDACRPTLRVPLVGTLSSETKPADFERFAARVKEEADVVVRS